MKTISYAASKWGYVVQVCDGGEIVEVYHAGNHKQDSQVTVPPHSIHAESEKELQAGARKTALEMASEWKVPKKYVQYDSDLHDEINGLDELIHGTIKLPRCWRRLVSTVFKGDALRGYTVRLGGKTEVVTSEHYQKGNDDPLPHYDDGRCVAATMPDGVILNIDLQSGQTNYYGAASLEKDGEYIYESEDVIESFCSPLEMEADNGKTYVVEIEWVGEDPYEKK